MTSLRCWWRLWTFSSPTSFVVQHNHRTPRSKRCHQHRNSVTNIKSTTSTCHQNLCSRFLVSNPLWLIVYEKRKIRISDSLPVQRILKPVLPVLPKDAEFRFSFGTWEQILDTSHSSSQNYMWMLFDRKSHLVAWLLK